MSAIEFIMHGGMASTGGDLTEAEQKESDELIKRFGKKVKELGRALMVPANQLSIFKMNFLFVAKDQLNYHFAFVDKPGGNSISYRDLTQYGTVAANTLIHQLKIEVGEVHWIFSVPVLTAKNVTDEQIENYAKQYVEAVLQASKKTHDKVSDQAISVPELGKFIEAFREDYPVKQKTAFIIMQFGSTTVHSNLVAVIKDTLKKHGIIGLRVDDKEYSDDLFSNIRTYMHCADFGISIFERVTEDNFNPNVSLEVGYMMGLGKSVCLLKDKTLKNLHSDLVGKLYKPFDPLDVEKTLPNQLEKWLSDKGFI
jgi:hypothetical protein